MDELIAKMRKAFAVAVVWCDWPEADIAEYGALIRDAIAREDEAALQQWHTWLREEAGLDFLEPRCRLAEQHIHEAAEQATRAAA